MRISQIYICLVRIMAPLYPYIEGILPTTNSLDLLNNEHIIFWRHSDNLIPSATITRGRVNNNITSTTYYPAMSQARLSVEQPNVQCEEKVIIYFQKDSRACTPLCLVHQRCHHANLGYFRLKFNFWDWYFDSCPHKYTANAFKLTDTPQPNNKPVQPSSIQSNSIKRQTTITSC